MSLSNPKQILQNPATKFIKFREGKLVYWQKPENENESGKEIELKLPFFFIPIDVLSTITGYYEKAESSLYSNEIHSLKYEVLSVKYFGNKSKGTQGGNIISGIYKEIKPTLESVGAKFTFSVYGITKFTESDFELVNIQFSGINSKQWMDFSQKNNIDSGIGCQIKSFSSAKKGKIEYYIPDLLGAKLKPEHHILAIEFDKKLQKYFKDKKENSLVSNVVENNTESEIKEQEKILNDSNIVCDDLPF